MQIGDSFVEMITLLTELVSLTTSILVVGFILLLCNMATARNTQVLARHSRSPPRPKGPSFLRRLRERLHPSIQLPESDKKELVG